ncbi:MFS transporter [Burkholderia alba]|uniref:MFS transporter n=1 Tax=Burkholderia alba TaxID=2683677 RepID=UPI002B05FF1B|nr:MFS transporter [Burkholderia alba]
MSSHASSDASPLRLPAAFRRLAWSNLVAQSAEQISLAAAPLVAVFALRASATDTGLLQTAQTLPFLLLSIPLGVWADRRGRRALMAGAEGLRALAMLGVVALLQLHALSLPGLALLGGLAATGTVAYSVAAPALVATLVPRDALSTANGRIELARSAAYSAGPALGGLLVGWVGAGCAYACAAALSALAASLLAGLREPPRPPGARRRFLLELGDGARFVLRDTLLRPMLATAVFFNLGFFTLQAIYVPYAAHRLGLSATAVGITLGAYGAGMVCGALAAPSIARRLRFGRVLTIGPCCGLLASLAMASTLALPSFWLAAASFFLFGAGPILWTVSSTTLRQAITPAGMMARVSAINSTSTYGARPLGALLGACVSAHWGMSACLVAAAASFAAQAAIIVLSPAVRLARIPHPGAPPAVRR